nr:hypothetical protein [Tanacetum cinerariifolium]
MLPKFSQIVNQLYAFIYETNHSKSGLGFLFIVALVMVIDKSWTSLGKHGKAFYTDLKKFVDDCKPLVDSDGNIRCPCKSCRLVLWFFQNVFPTAKGYKLPPSYYAIKKTFKTIGLGYESIHACVNDCFLFWGDGNKDVHICPMCNTSRWNDSNTLGKKAPKKVLRYFSIIPRLQRLYKSSHTAKEMTLHAAGKCTEPGLAADGFNPFGNLSQSYSMWPVILITYNLPPWLCMKESSFMLPLLIYGPKSPGKNIDVYLRPLIEGLKDLWAKLGVETIDVAIALKFNMRAMVLWTINDFSARISLSGWSRQGNLVNTAGLIVYAARVFQIVLIKGAYDGYYCSLDVLLLALKAVRTDAFGSRIELFSQQFILINFMARFGFIKEVIMKKIEYCFFGVVVEFHRSSLDFNGQIKDGDPSREFSRNAIMTQLARLLTCVKGKHPRMLPRNLIVPAVMLIALLQRVSFSPEIDTYRAKFKSEFPNKDMKEESPTGLGSSELFTLACGPSHTPISVNSCVVNGVRFVVHGRDERRTTQNNDIYSDDEDLVDLDIDDGVNISADVARGHDGDGGGDDRPPPYQIPTGCGGFLGTGTQKPSLGGRRAGKMHIRQETQNLRLKAITNKNSHVPIRFEFGDKETLMPLSDHATHWANYLEELVKELSLHYTSRRQMPLERKAGLWQRLSKPSLTCVPTWNSIAGQKSMRASSSIRKRSTMARSLLSRKGIGFLNPRTGLTT